MENMDRKVERMVRRSAKRRLWKRFVAIPAAVVVFVTTYALILPAIALEGDTYCGIEPHRHTEECYTAELACGYEDGAVVQDVETWMELACTAQPHQHTEACYDEAGNLICGYADYFIHEHNADCYDASGALICPLPEVKAHVHDESCYVTETVNVCGQEESAGHVHDASCYTLVSHLELICGQAESEGHVHTEACFTTTENTYLACGMEESAGHVHDASCYTVTVAEDGTETMELTCGQEESVGHTHTEACYITEPVTELTCGQEESVGHVHTDACFANVETMELTCGQEESAGHTHTDACFAQQKRLVCAQPEVIPHVHSDECWTVTSYAEDGSEIRELTCGMTEIAAHVHTAECFATYETTVERPHQHTDLCYVQVLTCTLPEHEHTAECYVAPEPTAAPAASEEPADGETAEEPADGEAAEEPVDGEAAEEPADGEAAQEPIDGETAEHIDGESAEEPEYICGMEEHTHGEECFDANGELICQIEEHTHDESCLAEVVEIIEDELAPAEEPEYICGKEEHTHGEECFDANGELICQIEEHTHDETCLAEVVDIEDGATPLLDRLVLICDKEEHIHGPECMNEALEYICGKEVHEHSADCYATVSDEGKIVYCGVAEHTHDGSCYDANGKLICELAEHTHDELCYLPPEAAELQYAASRQVKTFANDDVLVTVVYGPEANIPVQSELFVYQVTEQSEPERYAQRVAEMKAMLMPETLEDVPAEADLAVEETVEEPPILIYNIGFYMNGVEIEPAAPVTVTVHVLNEDHMPTGESYAIVHFAETGTQVLENTVDEAGAATFTTESFSDFGVAMSDAGTGADTDPLPEPETQSDEPQSSEPAADENQGDAPVVDEPQSGEPVADEPQADEGETTDEPESTEMPIIASGPAMSQASNENNDYGIMPMSISGNSWPAVTFSGTLGGNFYSGAEDYDTKRSGYNQSDNWKISNIPDDGWNSNVGNVVDYDLRGWYPIEFEDSDSNYWGYGFSSYYTAGGLDQTIGRYNNRYVVVSRLFYGDWWPDSYTASGSTGADTSGLGTIELFDFNELANIPFTDDPTVNQTTTGSGYNRTTTTTASWTLNGSFAFVNDTNYGSGTIGNPSTNNRNSIDGSFGNVSADVITGLFSSQNPANGSGINYVGQGNGLYQHDESTGYYWYDSNRNAVNYDAASDSFYLSGSNNKFRPLGANNCWFGMKSTISFTLGASQANSQDKIFKISADDDVLVYVDGQLILDMTGQHSSAAYGEINFSANTWAIYDGTDHADNTISASGNRINGGELRLTGDADTEHTVTIYYVDQKSDSSHYAVYFNMVDASRASGGTNTGRGTVAGKKTIDYLGDGDTNGYSFPAGADNTQIGDMRDLYRLYLTASNNREANPINVLLILDVSDSMNDNGKLTTLKNYVRNTLIDTILPGNNETSNNRLAIVTFSGSERTNDHGNAVGDAEEKLGWSNNKETAKTTVWNLPATGGTNYTRALQEAQETLQWLVDKGRSQYQTFVLFLSDGRPTFSVGSNGNRQGDGINTVYGDALTTTNDQITTFNTFMRDNFTLRTVRAIAYGTDTNSFLTDIDGSSRPISASSTSQLTTAIEQALQLTPVSQIVIRDQLSDYVQFAGAAADPDSLTDVRVYLNKTDETVRKTPVWANGRPTESGYTTIEGQVDPVSYVQSVSFSDDAKNITVTFNPGYVLPNNYEFEVSFNVRLTQKAYDEYAVGQGDGTRYPDTGDSTIPGTEYMTSTDYGNNRTSTGQPGFYSNISSGAQMGYMQDNNHYNVTYPDPVVQVWRPVLKVVKMDENGEPITESPATFELYYWNVETNTRGELVQNGQYSTTDTGSFSIENLPTGEYILQETGAPAGYQEEPKGLRITVENGLIKAMASESENWDIEGVDWDQWEGKWSWHDELVQDPNPDYPNSKWVFNYSVSLKDRTDELKLQITKEELGNPDHKVEGAKFNLWQDIRPEDMADDSTYVPEFDKDGDTQLYKDLTSGADGILHTTDNEFFVKLGEGVYFLEETYVPDGYYKLEEPITIYVTYEEGHFSVSYRGPHIEEGGTATPKAEDNGGQLYQMTIYNTYGYELPETGGEGTAMYTLGGIALIALAGAMLCDRRRKAARG